MYLHLSKYLFILFYLMASLQKIKMLKNANINGEILYSNQEYSIDILRWLHNGVLIKTNFYPYSCYLSNNYFRQIHRNKCLTNEK